LGLGAGLSLVEPIAAAPAAPDPGLAQPAPQAAAPDPATAPHAAAPNSSPESCVENVPEGKPRPKVKEKLPDKALSGHLLNFEVTVRHGKGETVLPAGLKLEREGEAADALEAAGFLLPDPKGPLQPTQHSEQQGDMVVTTLTVPFIPLAPKSGRQQLTLPPLPISVARASGDVVTVCTRPHRVTVDEPIANSPNPKPHGNPHPLRQLEVWHAAQKAALGGLLALFAAALAALLWRWWRRRPRRLPPPPPPRPPWEVALEELFDIRNAGLVPAGRLAEHFDRVSDVVRKYLGARFDFDGLESTTREALHRLRNVKPGPAVLPDIERFLREADLVKFARQTPTEVQCSEALTQAEAIVTATRPVPPEAPSGLAPSPTGESPQSTEAEAPAVGSGRPPQVEEEPGQPGREGGSAP
jgi:hypothetical protein